MNEIQVFELIFCRKDADSDDEWQSLIDATDCEKHTTDEILSIMNDAGLVSRLLGRFTSSSAQVLDAILEGASCLRPLLRIINNLISLKWYVFLCLLVCFDEKKILLENSH